ncbi:MAG: type II CAAX endopeptidase family protein [Leptolyngbyaceae cyanobacterium MO_188.B28]|nr:type II CAAX endopeptidase family protein [Leptolyngbyaceae cyanobacterium MO_188.B28]
MLKKFSRQQAVLALILLVPAPSIGVMMSVFIAPGGIGQTVFTAIKIWLIAFPIIWTWRVERGQIIPFSWFRRQGIQAGVLLGLLMFGVIVGAYWLLGQSWIEAEATRAKAQEVGITGPWIFLAGAAYWTFINALIEEYIWRGFVYRHCESLISGIGAVSLSALFFTIHHTIALTGYFQDWRVIILGSLGVFSAGAIWSGCCLKYRSLWPSYLSHMLADGAIALVGWHMLFG